MESINGIKQFEALAKMFQASMVRSVSLYSYEILGAAPLNSQIRRLQFWRLKASIVFGSNRFRRPFCV
jgi:hypothetical protein